MMSTNRHVPGTWVALILLDQLLCGCLRRPVTLYHLAGRLIIRVVLSWFSAASMGSLLRCRIIFVTNWRALAVICKRIIKCVCARACVWCACHMNVKYLLVIWLNDNFISAIHQQYLFARLLPVDVAIVSVVDFAKLANLSHNLVYTVRSTFRDFICASCSTCCTSAMPYSVKNFNAPSLA